MVLWSERKPEGKEKEYEGRGGIQAPGEHAKLRVTRT